MDTMRQKDWQMSLEEIKEIMSLYNGTGIWAKKYGDVTMKYYEAFSEYNECGLE